MYEFLFLYINRDMFNKHYEKFNRLYKRIITA